MNNLIVVGETLDNLWECDMFQHITYGTDYPILIYSQNTPNIEDIILGVKNYVKPKVIIHLSDEWKVSSKQRLIYEDTPLVLRQYSYAHLGQFNNVVQIPLGCMNGYKVHKHINPVDKREYIFGFCGDLLKGGRRYINNSDILQFISKYKNYCMPDISVWDMSDIYNNSIFMPNRRGNMSLDCLRIYESCSNGCIPIIKGNLQELCDTFRFNINNEPLPFIFCEQYDEVFKNKLDNLLNDTRKLQIMSDACRNWYKKQIEDINKKLREL